MECEIGITTSKERTEAQFRGVKEKPSESFERVEESNRAYVRIDFPCENARRRERSTTVYLFFSLKYANQCYEKSVSGLRNECENSGCLPASGRIPVEYDGDTAGKGSRIIASR